MNARILALLGIAGALILVIVALFARAPVAKPPGTALAPQVSLATVRQGTVEETISVSGRVGAPAGTQTRLAFAVPGAVQSVDVSLGEHVERGQRLAQLDATPYSLAANQAESEANAATHAAALAAIDRTSLKVRRDEVEVARQQRLYTAGIVALRDVEAAQTTLWTDRGEARSARLQVAQAREQSSAAGFHAADARYDVAQTALRAPASGTVAGIFVTRGQVVDATTAAVSLSSDGQTLATLDVPGSQLARIAAGDVVVMRAGNSHWEGRVEGVAAAVDPVTSLAPMSVSGVPAGLPAGAPIDAVVAVRRIRGLVVPVDAVVEDPQTARELVFVRTQDSNGNSRFDAREVVIDARDDRFAHVVSGLRESERVAAKGAIDLLEQPRGSD
ncbi:MAG: efflux RND transporter periplasmic adaptor subunit [Candidatus Cybelea sp.]